MVAFHVRFPGPGCHARRVSQPDFAVVRRKPDRAVYDRQAVHAILDEAYVCHVGLTAEGRPLVIPMIHARVGETLYLHGSPASRLLRTLASGVPACATATLIDGLVLARSAFHHSMNYRSAVVFGTARLVDDDAEKDAALRALVDHVLMGRGADARPPNDKELRGTKVVALPIEAASAKQRVGGPVDDEEDMGLPVWAGVVPLRLVAGEPQPDPANLAPRPTYLGG
jgi:hypothetical protein